jgi:GNAT superfamily N-acetyltransferase
MASAPELRAMRAEDVSACADVFGRALDGMRAAIGLAPGGAGRLAGGVPHLLGTDPEGSFVAVGADGDVVGFAQAARRGELWVLSHLFVAPESQRAGVGGRLLAAATAYAADARAGIVASTPDPRAIRAYARLPGFEVHPALTATGTLARRPAEPAGVDEGGVESLALAAEVDRAVRGGPHGPDLEYLLAAGSTLLVVPERGYALAAPSGPELVAALDAEAAELLLTAALARCEQGADVRVKRVCAGQQWAVRVAIEAGLGLSPWGPLVTRGCDAATAAYLPDSAFC